MDATDVGSKVKRCDGREIKGVQKKKKTSYPDGVLSLTTQRFGKEAWSFYYALPGRRLASSTTQKGGSTPYTGQTDRSERKRRERAIVSA